jgi:dipeptidyl aminopeptidase/acylaminoacyl peptidase
MYIAPQSAVGLVRFLERSSMHITSERSPSSRRPSWLRLVAAAAVVAATAVPAWAQGAVASPAGKPSSTGLPPLIDRELFFGNPEITGAQISPDGQYIAFIKPYKDTRNIWVKKTGDPFDAARLVTADTKRPIPGYAWTRDSRFILFVQDNAGDENYNLYAVNPADQPASGQDAPPARNLTDAKSARAFIYAVPKTQPDVLYVGLNDRDAAWHDVYRVHIASGKRELVRQNTERISGWVFDLEGRLRLATRTTDDGSTEILEVADSGFRQVYSCTVFESCGPVRFHKDGRRVYMQTNKGDTDLVRLVLFDPSNGSEEVVESDPLKRVDFGNAIFSDLDDEMKVTSYQDERRRLYFRDTTWEADHAFLTKQLGNKEVNINSSTADETRWLVSATSDTEPGATYLFDRRARQLAKQYVVREKLPREHLAAVTSIRYTSSDGLEIPAYLTLPKGVAPKHLPVVVVPHGGPWARDTWGYNSMAQFLANRGYAVLQPNFRGSTGYGKTFLNAGNKQWGDLMQDDITWGVKHLVSTGIADPKRVGIMGGSYGGYATLAGVAFTPDLYAAGVAIVAPSNLITLMDSIPPYWEAVRKIFHARMADPGTPEGKKQLERQSPLNSADKITTPLLVVQGANDPRVKQAESDQIVIALRDRGFPVKYLVAPDEGHGFARPVNNMAMFAAAEAFLGTHLGSRFQEDMPADVAARLKEITVDPKTVTLKKNVETTSVGAPTPVAELQPGTTKYQAAIAAGGQNISMDVTQVIAEENGVLVATETAQTPMGEISDRTTLDKRSLQVKKRSMRQGPVEIELTFDGDKATGTMAMNGQSKPVDVTVGGPVFGDGAAGHAVLARLPLADGYTTTYRNFDVQRQKPTIKQLTVAGSEDVTVPAGQFTTWKVELASAEGEPGATTVWVDKATRKVVKTTATLPQMGGATLTSELAAGS